ncbi:MAG: hypothetical protein M3Q24_02170, partial [bacterium]|nr:hypothetical protein [bacterium]
KKSSSKEESSSKAKSSFKKEASIVFLASKKKHSPQGSAFSIILLSYLKKTIFLHDNFWLEISLLGPTSPARHKIIFFWK